MRSLQALHAVISAKALVNQVAVVGLQAQELLAIVDASRDKVAALPDDSKAKAIWAVFDGQRGHAPEEVLAMQSGQLLALTSLIEGVATGQTPAPNAGGLLTGTIPAVITPPPKDAAKTEPKDAAKTEPTK